MSPKSQIKVGALLSYFSLGVNILAGLIYTPWMINKIGKSDYGLYMLSMSFIAYFVIDLGLSQSVAKYIAEYRVKKDFQKISQLLGLVAKTYLLLDIIILIILFPIYFYLENIFSNFTQTEIQKFKVIYSIGALYSLVSFPFISTNGIFIAYERFIVLKVSQLFLKLGTLLLMLIALSLNYGLYALVSVNAVVGISIIVYKWYYLIKNLKIKIDFFYFDKNVLLSLLRFSFWVFILSISQKLFIQIEPTLIGIYSTTSEIAVFSIAIVIEGYVYTIASSLNGLFLTKVTELENKNINTIELMIKVGRIQLIIIGLLIVGIIVFGKEFIFLWVGISFKDSYWIIILITSLGFFTLTQQIAETLLFVKEKVKYKSYISITSSVFSILISIILIPKYGAIGAGIGIFISMFLFHVIATNIMYYKILKLNIYFFFKETYFKLFPLLVLLGGLGILLQYYVISTNLFTFIVKIILFSISYFILIWFWGINDYEKKLINRGVISIRNKISLKK